MKNTKLTKDMKHNIARAMYDVYHNKTMEYWWESFQNTWVCYLTLNQRTNPLS